MTKRRQFFQLAGAAALSALPWSRGHAAPTQENGMIIGHGDFRFKVDKNWGKLDPRRQGLQHCHEMVLDSRGRLVCSVVSDKFSLIAYNKDGKVLNTFQHRLLEPHGLSTSGEGSAQTFWLTDSARGRVLNLDLDGRIIRQLNVPPDQIPAGEAFKPTETAVASNGDIYVADGYGTNKIFQFDVKGQLKNVFGGKRHFNCCHGIAIDGRNGREELLITSRADQEFQRWTMDGKYLTTRKLPGLQICRPVVYGDFTLFAVLVTKSWWSYDGMLAVLDRNLDVVSLPGGSAPTNQQHFEDVVYDNQTFMNPHDVCPDADGNFYVPQWYSGKTYPIRLRRV